MKKVFTKILSKPVSSQAGMTLIELMIYMSILTIVLVVMTNFIIDVTTNGAKTRVAKEVQQSGQLILGRLTQDIRTARAITSVQTDQLELETSDGTPVIYHWDGQDVMIDSIVLNAASVRITNLAFTQQGDAIDIELTVEQASTSIRAAEQAQTTLTSSIVPRRSIY